MTISRPSPQSLEDVVRDAIRDLLASLQVPGVTRDELNILALIEAALDLIDDGQVLRIYHDLRANHHGIRDLQRLLDHVGTWTHVEEGGGTKNDKKSRKTLGTPRDDRCTEQAGRDRDGCCCPYPGPPRPHHQDPNNEAHYRWSLAFHSLLYKLRLKYRKVARSAEGSETTLRILLDGRDWGMASTRLKFTWHLWLFALRRFTISELVRFWESGGEWSPDGVRDVCWGVYDGDSLPEPPAPELERKAPVTAA